MNARSRMFFLMMAVFCLSVPSPGTAQNLHNIKRTMKESKQDFAYIVGRVRYSVPFDKVGNAGTSINPKDYARYNNSFTTCPKEHRESNGETKLKCWYLSNDHKINEFFAYKIKPTDQQLAWHTIHSYHSLDQDVSGKPKPEKKAIKKMLRKYKHGMSNSRLRGFYIQPKTSLEKGKAYFIGDVWIELDPEKSFIEYGDQLFDTSVLMREVPKRIELLETDQQEVTQWLRSTKKYQGEIIFPKIDMIENQFESKFTMVITGLRGAF